MAAGKTAVRNRIRTLRFHLDEMTRQQLVERTDHEDGEDVRHEVIVKEIRKDGSAGSEDKMEAEAKASGPQAAWDYIYEPDAQSVIDDLLLRYVEAIVYQAVAENMASEQSARMVAMKSATDNAGNVINELKLVYNKARQAGITKELSEIVAGAAAV